MPETGRRRRLAWKLPNDNEGLSSFRCGFTFIRKIGTNYAFFLAKVFDRFSDVWYYFPSDTGLCPQ
jgi:hypothetical protein